MPSPPWPVAAPWALVQTTSVNHSSVFGFLPADSLGAGFGPVCRGRPICGLFIFLHGGTVALLSQAHRFPPGADQGPATLLGTAGDWATLSVKALEEGGACRCGLTGSSKRCGGGPCGRAGAPPSAPAAPGVCRMEEADQLCARPRGEAGLDCPHSEGSAQSGGTLAPSGLRRALRSLCRRPPCSATCGSRQPCMPCDSIQGPREPCRWPSDLESGLPDPALGGPASAVPVPSLQSSVLWLPGSRCREHRAVPTGPQSLIGAFPRNQPRGRLVCGVSRDNVRLDQNDSRTLVLRQAWFGCGQGRQESTSRRLLAHAPCDRESPGGHRRLPQPPFLHPVFQLKTGMKKLWEFRWRWTSG